MGLHCGICLSGLLVLASGCTARWQVQADYEQNLGWRGSTTSLTKKQTLVFFLVDGLSVPLLQRLINEDAVPHLRKFFLPTQNQFLVGQATFPSLTHVNISSILSSRDVDAHPIIGNRIFYKGLPLNFESPLHQDSFGEILRPYSIFTALSAQGRRSQSFAPYYGDQSTARYATDARLGLAYKGGNYAYVDGELIESLAHSLENTPPEQWPEFIFVHLMGIDGHSHRFGTQAPQVLEHARFLDQRLAPVLARLQHASIQQGHSVGAILTSDHGMIDVHTVHDIEIPLERLAPGARRLNQGRLITWDFASGTSASLRAHALAQAARLPGVEVVVEKTVEGHLRLYTRQKVHFLRAQSRSCGDTIHRAWSLDEGPALCPLDFDSQYPQFFYPYFATRLITYFRSPQSPDALVLARPGQHFGSGHAGGPRGSHGGLTPDEMRVPVLTWNVEIRSPERPLRTYKLLETLRRQVPTIGR